MQVMGPIRPRVVQLVGGIAIASRSQSSEIDAVKQAVSQIDKATQQNAALVEEAAALPSYGRRSADTARRPIVVQSE
jgi:hypothetical protein